MKEVILKQLTLQNFKGEKERTTVFNTEVTTIMGANGLGKSRHMDAFLWLLFGKDKSNRQNYEIKTRVNGEVQHKVDCVVEGVLSVDGEEVKLRRAFVEKYRKPRGQSEEVFDGNDTECNWNDVPINITEYRKRVSEIMDESLFKMITNPSYFADMEWKIQREQLFQLAGTVSDEEIAQQKPEYKALLDRISGKSFSDFKAERSAKKKLLKKEADQIQPRIDQTKKMMPESEDFKAIRERVDEIDKEVEQLDEAISNVAKASKLAFEAEQKEQENINSLKRECAKILNEAKERAETEAYEKNAARRKLSTNLKEVEDQITADRKIISQSQVEIARIHLTIRNLEEDRSALRKKWQEANEKEWDGETTCPHCGQQLPEEAIEKAQSIFNAAKMKKLDEINEEGLALNTKIESRESEVSDLKKKIEDTKKRLEERVKNADKLKEALSGQAEAKAAEVRGEEIPEWTEKQKEIADLEKALKERPQQQADTQYSDRKKELNAERKELQEKLAKESAIAKGEKEIADLEKRGKELAQQIADVERDEFVMQEFVWAKISECERRINGMFKQVSFKLYDYTQEGNLIETCEALIDGVPYGSANTAGRINAGLDIINTLCKFHGLRAPIFIDGAEGVNDLIATNSQLILLKVTTDKELVVE